MHVDTKVTNREDCERTPYIHCNTMTNSQKLGVDIKTTNFSVKSIEMLITSIFFYMSISIFFNTTTA